MIAFRLYWTALYLALVPYFGTLYLFTEQTAYLLQLARFLLSMVLACAVFDGVAYMRREKISLCLLKLS